MPAAGLMLLQKSPFKHCNAITTELIEDFKRIRVCGEPLESNIIENKVNSLCTWLCETPNSITYRINTSVTNAQEIYHLISQQFRVPPCIKTFKSPEIITVNGWADSVNLDLEICSNEIIVDASCGAAVLRGAHVFAPGILSMPQGLHLGDKVSVFADASGKCKKGAKFYDDPSKVFVGNGMVQKNRRDLFEEGACPSGIGILITATQSRLPQLSDTSMKKGFVVLQNTPSIICSRILDPQPGERVLDMCAAPGNKTTHLSALMNGEGTLIALEKIKSKIERLGRNCEVFSCKNVHIYCFDSTKAISDKIDTERKDTNEPAFPEECFDRILLDGPCSGLGQRPQILNTISPKQLQTYVPLQRKLFSTAVKLLKIGGVLVYSTCTITIAENEGIVAWALKNFPELKLSSPQGTLESMGLDKKYCGTSGYSIDGLTEDESKHLLRFGPESDTIGFFIARFVKTTVNVQKQ